MEHLWILASVWVLLALIATLLAIWFKISTALTEIIVGVLAQLLVLRYWGHGGLEASAGWITFLAGAGAIILTFLAGAELDPTVFRAKWKEATIVRYQRQAVVRGLSSQRGRTTSRPSQERPQAYVTSETQSLLPQDSRWL